MNIKTLSNYLAPAITVLLLSGISIDHYIFHRLIGDSEPYHKKIRMEAAKMPLRIEDWIGVDVDVPPSAVALLKPNVLKNRRFRNLRTGQYVSLLLVQCGDARDLLGHYPPVCYVSSGWTQKSADPMDWQVDHLTIQGMEYEFQRSSFDRSTTMIIDNFMILPDGRIARDMDAVSDVADNRRKKIFGAAQIQFVFNTYTSSDDRKQILQIFVAAIMPILDAIRAGEYK